MAGIGTPSRDFHVLAGDFGGTNARLALVRVGGNALEIVSETRVATSSDLDLRKLCTEFVQSAKASVPSIKSAVFAVAAPIVNQTATLTNVGLAVSADQLAFSLSAPCHLLNDLHALAIGIIAAPRAEFRKIGGTSPGDSTGHGAVIAPGTGLGEAGLVWDGVGWQPVATEGGHADYAPARAADLGIFHAAQELFGEHVSWERILGGAYCFSVLVKFLEGMSKLPTGHPLRNSPGSSLGAQVAKLAESSDPVAEQILELYSRLLGQEAGNLALKFGARGGVFVAGGMIAKLEKLISWPIFWDEFCRKGRFTDYMKEIPVYLAADDFLPIKGAAEYGRRFK